MTFSLREVAVAISTSGLEFDNGDRIVEVGCTEIINREITGKEYHSRYQLADSKKSIDGDARSFQSSGDELLEFFGAADLVIHNAGFALGFLDNEFQQTGLLRGKLYFRNMIIDTYIMARNLLPGRSKSVPALAQRFALEGLLEDLDVLQRSRLLAQVYLPLREQYYS